MTAQFQPRIDLSTGAARSAEATGLWQLPDGHAVPSSVFLPALARDGRLLAFVDRVVSDASVMVDQAGRGGVDTDGGMRIALNVSLLRLSDAALADRLTDIVRRRGLNPGHFVWELDDVVLARAPAVAAAALTRLRVKGFGLSMRLSGTGLSLTSQVGRVPLTELKLDGRLVNAAMEDATVLTMLESSVAFARDAGLQVVADGCGSRATFDALLALGSAEAMGRFIAGPMTSSELVSWVLAGCRGGSLRSPMATPGPRAVGWVRSWRSWAS